MALDPRYIVASDLEQYFVDKTSGLPLANGTLTFYRDSARNVPKPVYQLSGSPPNYTYTSMGAQITLSAVGTVQNSGGDNEVIYYFPYDVEGNLDLYYVDVRSQGGVQQFTREAWPPNVAGNDPTKDQTGLQNQISNPTFTNVLINEGKTTTYTVSAANNQIFEFAPNWDFVISGTGTVTVQRIAITGNEKVPTSPPFMIDVLVSAGISTCYLRQRFLYNSGLWSSNTNAPLFLAGSFVARNESIGTTGLQMFYASSSGGSPVLIVDGSFQSNYQLISGSTENMIPASTDTNSGRDGYVDIYLSFITGSHIRFSSVQLIPTASDTINLVHFDVDSSNRNEAYQGDYYIPRASAKRIPSYLIGWDFANNPFQFGFTGSLSTTPAYIADQTIAMRGSTGNITYNAVDNSAGIEFVTAGTNDSFYVMQYLTGDDVRTIVENRLSVNVFAYQGAGAVDKVTTRVYLFRGGAAATVPLLPTPLGTLAADGTFALTAANWTAIPRGGLDTPQADLNKIIVNTDINNGTHDHGFSGWQIIDNSQLIDTNKFAIVVTFYYPDINTDIIVESISVVPGDLPCRPGVESVDETLRKCQRYYEKSYQPSLLPGTITGSGSIIQNMPLLFDSGSDGLYAKTFSLIFKTVKRTIPSMTFYAPTSSTPGLFLCVVRVSGGPEAAVLATFNTFWILTDLSIYVIAIKGNFPTTAIISKAYDKANEGYYVFHYVADARLGIVT